MEIRRAVCLCIVVCATFLSLASSQQDPPRRGRERFPSRGRSRSVAFLREPKRLYYVSKKTPANVTCEAAGATRIVIMCAGNPVNPTTFERYDDARMQTVVTSFIAVTREEVQSHQKREREAGSRAEYGCQCTAEDEADDFLRSRRAVFRLAFMRKQFQQEPASQSVETGASVVFNCDPPLAKPAPEVLWRKDSRRISGDKDDNFKVGADNSLTIVSVRAQDAGNYECVARNDVARRISAAAALTITERRDEEEEEEEEDGVPVFLETPDKEIYVAPDQSVPIVCHIQGTKMMTLRCNTQRVPDQKLRFKEERDPLRYRIQFNLSYAEVENYVNSYSDEKYKCECVAWYRTPLGDRGWGEIKSNISMIYRATLDRNFEAEPKDVTAQVGTLATLTCKPPMGAPNPWVYWVFEQQRIDLRSDARYRLEGDGSLLIQPLRSSDQGNYYCVAQNMAGSVNSRVAYLTVSDDPVMEKDTTTEPYVPTFPAVIPKEPLFTRDLQSEYYLNDEGEATLVCSVVASQQLTFRCNNERVVPEKQTVGVLRHSSSNNDLLLTATTVVTYDDIDNSQLDNYTCQCIAWHRVGKDWISTGSTMALITLPYIDSTFIYEPKGGLYYVGDTAELACQPPSGKPTPRIEWIKDGEILDPEMDDNIFMGNGGTLIVESVRLQDAGEYICSASNSAGTRSSILAELEVEGTTTSIEETTTTTTTTTTPQSTTTTFSTTTDETTTTMSSSTTPTMIQPFFTALPDENVYIVNGRPVEINCGAMQASALRFFCNGERVLAQDEELRSVNPTPGLSHFEKSIEVTQEDVEDFAGPEPYTCQCRAYFQMKEEQDGEEKFMTAESVIRIAYLNRDFVQSPMETFVDEGDRMELVCQPPEGVPQPKVFWLKNGFNLQEPDRWRVTKEGSLVFEQVQMSDSGSYTCAAENMVSTRYSSNVDVSVLKPGVGPREPTPTPTTPGETSTTTTEKKTEVTETTTDDEDPESETTPEIVTTTTTDGDNNVMGVDKEENGGMESLFVVQPESMYYIIKSNPATIFCQTRGAQEITFRCNGENMSQSLVQYENDIPVEAEGDGLKASFKVSRSEVETFQAQNPDAKYYCQCLAHYPASGDSQTPPEESSRGHVEVAFLRKMFTRHPENVTVAAGEFVSLSCEPPEGNPTPQTKWMKGEEEVMSSVNTPDHSLVIENVNKDHVGTYHCVSSNVANVRTSHPGSIALKDGTDDMPLDETKCPQLQTCHDVYMSKLPMPDPSQDMVPTDHLCRGIEQFMRCADNAMIDCNMTSDDSDSSLIFVANFYDNYCTTVVDNRWGEDCDSLVAMECQVPKQLATDLKKMVQVKLWCKQIAKTMKCTKREVKDCGIQESMKDEMEFLSNAYSVNCPMMSGEEDEDDDDDNDGDDDDDNLPPDEGVEPGKSVKQEGDENDGDGSGAWTARASVVLTSLLSLLFALTACR